MRDWRRLVREHLPALPLRPEREAEVVDELAQLLEDSYAACPWELSEAETAEWLRTQVPEWRDLATEISRADKPLRGRWPLSNPVPRPRRATGDNRRGELMNTLWNDTRFALRMLAKNPGFTAVAALTLALGIGTNSAVFSVVNALLLRPMPVAEPQRLINVYATTPLNTGMTSHLPMSFPDYEDLRDDSQSIESLVAYSINRLVLDDGAEHHLIGADLVTGNYFETLGVGSILGRTLTPEDDRRGESSPVAVISHRSWRTRFGGDPDVIGKTVHVNGQPVTLIGVASPGFDGLVRALPSELWIPMNMSSPLDVYGSTTVGDRTEGLDRYSDRAWMWIWVLGRLAPASSVEQAAAELDAQTTRFQQQYPDTNENRTFVLARTNETFLVPSLTQAVSGASAVVMALVGLVLLIVCANLANMLLARALFRRKEIATRLALGASRAMVVRQLLAESLALAFLGGAVGLMIVGATNRLLTTISFSSILRFELDLAIDWRVALFTFGAATATAVAFGLAPAFASTRGDLSTALHEESRGMAGGLAKRRLRSALVVAQVALALLLLICAGLSLRSMGNAHHIDPGFDPDGVAVARYMPPARGMTDEQRDDFYRTLKDRTEAMAGVRSASFATNTPLSVLEFSTERVSIEGQITAPQEHWPETDVLAIGPDYFETMGLPLLRGRGVAEHDTEETPRVAVVNETLAGILWPEDTLGSAGAVLGRRFAVSGSDDLVEVIGVAQDAKYRSLGESPRPFAYFALDQTGIDARTLIVRTDRQLQPFLATLRQLSRDLDRRMAIIDLGTMERAIGPSLLLPRTSAMLFGTFGLIGLLLAATGIYGVIAYMTGQRTHEIGIRMAMGARRSDVLRLIVRDGVALTLVGVVLGLAGALALTRLLASILYGISATDVLTFTAVPLLLGLVAFLASYLPARRASRVDPLTALRYE